jgi:hypothetical protein
MDNYDELLAEYTRKAKEVITNWRVPLTVHLVDIVRSVMMHRDGVQTGGHFVRAVCSNDLFAAIERADATCREHLNIIVSAYLHARINNTVQHV